MVGSSLLGISQWLTAKEAPPSLKVIVPQVACGDCYGLLWYPAGMTPGPGREARKLSPGAEAEYETSIQHRDLDDWWRERLTLGPDIKSIAGRGVAAFISGGLQASLSDPKPHYPMIPWHTWSSPRHGPARAGIQLRPAQRRHVRPRELLEAGAEINQASLDAGFKPGPRPPAGTWREAGKSGISAAVRCRCACQRVPSAR